MTTLDWSIISAYMLFALGIGLYFSKRAGGSLEGFFLSGRSLPWWLASVSLVASHFSASFPIKVSSLVRIYGVHHNWLQWYLMLGVLLGAFFFAQLWRRAGILTLNELHELRYSGKAAAGIRLFNAVYQGLIMQSIWLGMSLIAMEKISMAVLPDINPTVVIVIVCLFALSYSVLAGLYGVVATDFIQFVVAMAGCIFVVGSIYSRLGGPDGLVQQVTALPGKENAVNIMPMVPSTQASRADWMDFISFLLYIGFIWIFSGAQGSYATQRLMAAKNERHAALSLVSMCFLENAMMWVWIVIGLGSLVILGLSFDNQAAFPALAVRILPAGLKGVFVAAIVAALMSTVDTHLNFGSSLVVNDIYKRFLHPRASEKHFVIVSRITTILIMAMSVIVWLYLLRGTRIVDNFKMIMMAFAGLGPVAMLKWYWWRINAWSEITAMVASFCCMALLKFGFTEYKLATDYFPIGMTITILVAACVWVPATFLTEPTDRDTLAKFYRRVRPSGPGWGPIALVADCPARSSFTRYDALAWVISAISVYSFSFGLGKTLLGQYAIGILLLAASVLALALLLKAVLPRTWWNLARDELR